MQDLETVLNYPKDEIDVFEGMISIRSVFDGIDSGACDRKIHAVLFSENSVKGNGKLLGFLKARSFVYDYNLSVVSDNVIENYADGSSHGGVIMLCSRRSYPALPKNIPESGFYVVLEGVEDPFNLGYAIRSLYAAGADGVIIPRHNAMMSAGTVCRSSAGASELTEVIAGDQIAAVKALKEKGYRLVCADMDAPAPAHLSDLKKPIILAVGGERRGFSKALLELSDLTVRLDYGREFKMALSAASAAAILSFEVTKQNT
jgi:23S rRNA (guanosine2251-2'-O)-methyltransferase